MNLLYEKLITAFLEKAKIERDANQIVHVLKDAYPNATLPNVKTIKRFLTGETHNPRETLGFLAAFVLKKTDEEAAERDISERVSKIMLTRLKITPRELAILKDFAMNLSGIEIAEKQHIAPETVKHHSKKMLKKARLNLSTHFKTVKEIAIYLKNIEII